jgi:hypothetical protein
MTFPGDTPLASSRISLGLRLRPRLDRKGQRPDLLDAGSGPQGAAGRFQRRRQVGQWPDCSGAMKASVPPEGPAWLSDQAFRQRATPKSISRGRPDSSIKMFLGSMSWWTTPRRCTYSSARAITAVQAAAW